MLVYRSLAIAVCIVSAMALLYVGLYQTRKLNRLWCPIFAQGCEAVANAPFAWPFGIPDGYIGFGLYAAIAGLLLAPFQSFGVWVAVMVLSVLAALAGMVGLWDMMRLGQFCFYCVITAALSPVLLWAVWQMQ